MRWRTGWQDDAFQFGSLKILEGRRFRDGLPEVMLGDLLAQALKKNPGDTLELRVRPSRLRGFITALLRCRRTRSLCRWTSCNS